MTLKNLNKSNKKYSLWTEAGLRLDADLVFSVSSIVSTCKPVHFLFSIKINKEKQTL